jgi:hypothetical protein
MQALKAIFMEGAVEKIVPLVAEGLTAADLRGRYAALLEAKQKTEAELEAVLRGAPRGGLRPAPSLSSAPRSIIESNLPFEEAVMSDLAPYK